MYECMQAAYYMTIYCICRSDCNPVLPCFAMLRDCCAMKTARVQLIDVNCDELHMRCMRWRAHSLRSSFFLVSWSLFSTSGVWLQHLGHRLWIKKHERTLSAELPLPTHDILWLFLSLKLVLILLLLESISGWSQWAAAWASNYPWFPPAYSKKKQARNEGRGKLWSRDSDLFSPVLPEVFFLCRDVVPKSRAL